MTLFKRFEDIEAWQKARVLAKEIGIVTGRVIYSNDTRLKNQMLGSSGSIMDNIAEGHGRGGNRVYSVFMDS